MLNMPVGDTFAIRLNAGMIDNDGIVDYPHVYELDANGDPVVNGDVVTALPVYTSVKDVDDVDIKYGRVSALFASSDVFSAQLSYQRQEDEVGGRRQVTSGDDLVNGGQYGEYEFGGIQLEPTERDVELAALELEVGLGFATLTSSTSWYDHSGKGISDNSGVYARNGWFVFYGSSPRPIAQAERFYDDSAVAQEFRLVSNGDSRVDWTAGFFYVDQDYDLGQNSYLVGYIPYLDALNWYGIAPYETNQDFLFRRNQKYEEMALFGEVTFDLGDRFELTVGGRYFDNEVDVDAVVDVPDLLGVRTAGTASETISDDDFLAKANLAWDMSDDSMVYLTYSQGYRHAGANAVPTTGKYAENPDFFTFDADSLDNYELGYKGSSDRLTWAVSLYYDDWKDPQLNTATSNWGFFGVINGESAESQGLEVELVRLTRGTFQLQLRLHLCGQPADRGRLPACRQLLRRAALHGSCRRGRRPPAGIGRACRHRIVAARHDVRQRHRTDDRAFRLLPVGDQQQPGRRRVPHGVQCDRQLPGQRQSRRRLSTLHCRCSAGVLPRSTVSISGTSA